MNQACSHLVMKTMNQTNGKHNYGSSAACWRCLILDVGRIQSLHRTRTIAHATPLRASSVMPPTSTPDGAPIWTQRRGVQALRAAE